MSSTTLNGLLGASIEAGLRSISAIDRRSIYAVSLFLHDEEDDPRRPTVTIGYNTFDQWQLSVPRASDSAEAKWNYAFWLQNEVARIGEPDSPSGSAIRSWIQARGLWWTDAEEEDDLDRCIELGEQITEGFVDECCDAVRALHASGVVTQVFGHPIPLVIHELEYYEQIAAQNERANPPNVCAEFAAWVRAG
jgi:hypothetical protein